MPTKGKPKRIGVLTGGGDCPGLNAVIRAVTKSAIAAHGLEVMGIEDGFLGLIEDRVRPLQFGDVSNILNRGGTILGTTNKANPSHYCVDYGPNGEPVFADVREKVLANAEKHGIDVLVCVGGDGTMSAASRVAELGLPIVGVPKTIDNDLMHTDVTFGFNTAVSIATEAMDRIRTTAASHSRVMLVETMGRNAGWIALYAGAASGADIILIPEIAFSLDKICEVCLRRSQLHKAYTLIAVAEGAKPIGGDVVVNHVVQEAKDRIRLGGVSEVLCRQIAERTRLECRATILGHVQRGGTPSAVDRILSTRFGDYAVRMVVRGELNRMAALRCGELMSVPLTEVADQQRLVLQDEPLLNACRAIGVEFGYPPPAAGAHE